MLKSGASILKRLVGMIVGALIAALLAAGTGIVGAFGGVSGLFVFPVIGAVIGFLAIPDISWLGKRLGKFRSKGQD